MIYTKRNIIRGGLIYSLGDTIAAFIQEDFSAFRVMLMLVIGATIYAFEIPNYFRWIERKTQNLDKYKSLTKMLLAILYFNPLWIARHLLFIKLAGRHFDEINLDLVKIAMISFIVNIPISLIANYLIQNRFMLSWRFMASAIFSGLMAIYYALSLSWFS